MTTVTTPRCSATASGCRSCSRCRSSSTARWSGLVRLLRAVVPGRRPGRSGARDGRLPVGGWPFLTGAVDEVRARRPGMMLLIAMAITVAFAARWATSLGLVRAGLLVGARGAGGDHAARPLDGDAALVRRGARSPRSPSCCPTRRSASRRRRSRPSRRPISRVGDVVLVAPAAGCPPTASARRRRPSSTSRW